MPLTMAKPGETNRIKTITGKDNVRRHLAELGFVVGESVTVGGLVTGGDLIAQLADTDFGRALLIPRAMLKADEPVFLDGVTVAEAEAALNTRILPVATGEDLVEILFTE